MNRREQQQAEQQAYEAHMQAMYDEQRRVQELEEQVTWLQEEVARLKAENEVLRQERPAVVAWLRTEVRKMPEVSNKPAWFHVADLADLFERGQHRREEKA